MKLNYFLAGALAISMAVTSCSEDLDMSVDESPNLKTRTVMSNDSVENYTIRVRYDGVLYDVPCQAYGDSVVYLNKEFEELFVNELSKCPNLITCINDDGVIEYFQSKEKFEKVSKLSFLDADVNEVDNILTRGQVVGDYSGAGEAILYDDTGCTDNSNLKMTIGYNYMLDIPRLKSFGMNDKTSSIQVKSYVNDANLRVVLIAFENDTYNLDNPSKAELYCIAKYNEVHQDLNLKQVPAHGRDSWNDRISSTRLRIATANLYEPHP